jgi:hypothetical protein
VILPSFEEGARCAGTGQTASRRAALWSAARTNLRPGRFRHGWRLLSSEITPAGGRSRRFGAGRKLTLTAARNSKSILKDFPRSHNSFGGHPSQPRREIRPGGRPRQCGPRGSDHTRTDDRTMIALGLRRTGGRRRSRVAVHLRPRP